MPILGYAAPAVKQDTSGTPAKAASNPQGIFQVADAFVSDKGYRHTLLANPDAALSAAGVNVGKAKIQMKYQEINEGEGHQHGAGQLLIEVENAGADWTGTVTLVLNK